MKNALFILSFLFLSGCNLNTNYDRLEGSWELECQLDNNIYSGIQGTYEFKNGMFRADMTSCDLSQDPVKQVSVEFPYSYGEYVMLGQGLEARELIIHIDSDYRVMTLVYEEDIQGERDRIYWTWGFNNTSIEHSVFGFASNDTEDYWGGYLVNQTGEDSYSPIKSLDGLNINTDFDEDIEDEDYDLDVERPTTVSFQAYIEEI